MTNQGEAGASIRHLQKGASEWHKVVDEMVTSVVQQAAVQFMGLNRADDSMKEVFLDCWCASIAAADEYASQLTAFPWRMVALLDSKAENRNAAMTRLEQEWTLVLAMEAQLPPQHFMLAELQHVRWTVYREVCSAAEFVRFDVNQLGVSKQVATSRAE